MKVVHLVSSLLLLVSGRVLCADSLSIHEVTRVAQARNPSIQAALRKWNAAKTRIIQAAAWEDPTVRFDDKIGRFVNVAPNAFTDQMLTLEQTIPLSGK